MRKWFPALALLGTAATIWFFWRQPSPPPADAMRGTTTTQSSSQPGSKAMVVPAKPNYSQQQTPDVSAVGAIPSGNPQVIANGIVNVVKPVAAGNPHLQELQFTNFPPEIVMGKVAHAIHDYASMFGGNPVGTNPEIAAALNGNNPRQSNFINPQAGMRINGSGELVDAWGTPYFFHQLSGTLMEIRSAGPDGILWTSDDLIVK
jgi:hypothetical protein